MMMPIISLHLHISDESTHIYELVELPRRQSLPPSEDVAYKEGNVAGQGPPRSRRDTDEHEQST